MGGMVNYSNESKEKHLGIPMDDIRKYGAGESPGGEEDGAGSSENFRYDVWIIHDRE